MKQEYTRDERLAGDRFSVASGGSSARLVREDEIDPAELRRKQSECGETGTHYIDMFCERYRDRGIAGRVHADAAKQEKKEALRRASAPGAYIRAEELADEMNAGETLDAYRSGMSDGRRYMTVDDFARYYHDQRGYKFPQYRTATDAERIAAVSAVVETRETRLAQPKKAGWLTETDKLPRPLRRLLAKPLFERINQWAGETFPREAAMSVERDEPRRGARTTRPIPAGLAAALVTVLVSMAMVISSTVAVSQATRELSEQKEALAELKDMHSELSDQLALKNDSLDIEDVAKNELGMVPEKYLGGAYLNEDKQDHLEVYDEDRDGEKKTGLAWLLSAFGWGE